MDKRRTIVGVLLTVIAIVGWVMLQNHYRSKAREQAQQLAANPQAPSLTQPATAPSSPATAAAGGTNPATQAIATTAPSISPDLNAIAAQPVALTDAKSATLGSENLDDPNHAMGLKLSPYGAGIDNVTLNSFRSGEDFKKPLKERRLYTMEGPYTEDPDASRPFSTAHVIVDGKTVSLAGIPWKLEKTGAAARPSATDNAAPTGEHAIYSAVITQGGEPKLKLTKTFTLFPRSAATQGYEVAVDLNVQNVGKAPASVQLSVNGPTLPPREFGRSPDRQLMAGYNDGSRIELVPHGLEKIKAESPSLDITKDEKGRVLSWAGTASTYFNAFVLFENPAQIGKATARAQAWDKQPDVRPVYLSFDTTAQTLQPNASYNVPMTAFFGPRWRDVVDQPPYSAMPRRYDETLVIPGAWCSICTFGWLVNGLVMLLNAFHWLAGGFPPLRAGDWGLAIIMLVALVRTLLHPVTKMSQVQMMKMAKMGPALQKLKEKHGDDKEAFTRAQMELMKEQGMAPILGCLPMFLQMPIWIALWQALQSTFELRQAPFLWGWTWISDLSRPDYLIHFGREIPLFFGMHIDGINLLPILMAIIFNVQATIQNRLQPKGTPEQESQKKMMKWMSTFLFPIFLYNGPSGLNLYILTSTLVGIIESKVIRDHIKQKEAAAKAAGPVVVDGPMGKGKNVAATAKRGGLMGWLQKLADQAEQMKREQEKKGPRKK